MFEVWAIGMYGGCVSSIRILSEQPCLAEYDIAQEQAPVDADEPATIEEKLAKEDREADRCRPHRYQRSAATSGLHVPGKVLMPLSGLSELSFCVLALGLLSCCSPRAIHMDNFV